jgi:hypothetical protein
VQGENRIDSIYAVQSALEVALKNSMLASKLKVYGKSPRFFYLDPDPSQVDKVLGLKLANKYRNVSYKVYRCCKRHCLRLRLTQPNM